MKPSRKNARILVIFSLILALILSTWLVKKNFKEVKSSLFQLVVVENQDTGYYDEMAEKLIMCESSDKPLTINAKDRDGTASFSFIQAKPETFRSFGIKYGIIGEKTDWNYIMTIIWNRETNKYLAVKILENEDMGTIRNLWGNCIRKIGFRK